MRPLAIVIEALLNLRSGTTRGGVFGVVLCVVLAALAAVEVTSVAALQAEGRRYRASGAATTVYVADGRIDGAACESLTAVKGVRAAGAIRAADKVTVDRLPGSRIPAFVVSPLFGGFESLGGVEPGAGVLVSAEVASTLGADVGDIIGMREGETVVGGVYDYADDGRTPGLGYAILMPTNDTRAFDQCWVEVWPQSAAVERLLPTTVRSETGVIDSQPPQVQQLNSTVGVRFDGADRFDVRVTRFAPAAAAVVAASLGFIAAWRRRLEFAAARHSGVRAGDLAAQLVVETTVWVAFAALWATGAISALIVVVGGADALPALSVLAGRVVVAGACATVIGSVAAVLLAREKHLFVYFKRR
ncbi:hypothetical protein ACFQ9V_03220 [Leifsonia sp. NPDC056665]|uniref:hypothetical protein n=1 Tax=Leifsonia sp. NPDC056665 TaxID=3345901 RepID=UPI00368389D4